MSVNTPDEPVFGLRISAAVNHRFTLYWKINRLILDAVLAVNLDYLTLSRNIGADGIYSLIND